ncbi:MAG: lactate utilization protein B [Planctomycetota bacterium]
MARTHMEHANDAAKFISNRERTCWHDQALWYVRVKRDKAAGTVPEWETLRDLAKQIKQHTLSRLGEYLEQFEEQAGKRGIRVHWARTAEEHNRIVLDILQRHEVRRVVKSKSMLTEECHLNPYLEEHGMEVVDTDLGERIVQLRKEPPSHIVLPAIHIRKEEVGETFHQYLRTKAGATDPTYLTEAARGHLRDKFMAADAGITGINFAVAETGGFVVCTNEGNADIGISLPKLHIACMGIEKLIPRTSDLAVFTRLLARNATGQPITTYTSHFHGPAPGGELHVVLVDNDRTRLLANDQYRDALRCIRCGACLNTCPVYRRSGGHSYHATIPGPIGSVLNPTRDAEAYYSLPYACSLCGSCADICPVKIPLDQLLLDLRGEMVAAKYLPWPKRVLMKVTSFVMQRTWLFSWSGKLARWFGPWMPRWLMYNRLNIWGRQREIPEFPKKSFRELYRDRKRDE